MKAVVLYSLLLFNFCVLSGNVESIVGVVVIYGLMYRQIENWVIKQNFFFLRFIYFWPCSVFVAACGLSLVAVRELLIAVASCCGTRALGSWASVVVHGFNRSMASAVFLEQVSNSCPLHWHADSQPLDHQGSLRSRLLEFLKNIHLICLEATNYLKKKGFPLVKSLKYNLYCYH